MKSLRYAIPLAVFVALAAFLAVGLTRDPREVPSPFIGKPAPAFKLTQLADEKLGFGPEDMKGKVWLLNVWASWCVSCRVEHPLLVEMSKKNVAGYRALLKDAIAAGELKPHDTLRMARAINSLIAGSLINWAIFREGTAERWVKRDLDTLLAPYRE